MMTNLKYYRLIEQDLINCSKYVEFNSENFDTFSIEFAKNNYDKLCRN